MGDGIPEIYPQEAIVTRGSARNAGRARRAPPAPLPRPPRPARLAIHMATHRSPVFNPRLTGLSCFSCGTPHDHRVLQSVCRVCGLPLRVDYDIRKGDLPLATLASRVASLWRYREVLPFATDEVTLAEGWTP